MSDNDYDLDLKNTNILESPLLQNKWRVKLYYLNSNGQWDDMGTGYVSFKKEVKLLYITKDEECYLKMDSEVNYSTMFELKLNSNPQFHRQRGTILTWKNKEEEEDDDRAISFQDQDSIRDVWYKFEFI